MVSVRLDRDSQIVVPEEVRRKLDLAPGDHMVFVDRGDGIVVRKSSPSALEMLASVPKEIWAGAAEEIQRDRDEWDR